MRGYATYWDDDPEIIHGTRHAQDYIVQKLEVVSTKLLSQGLTREYLDSLRLMIDDVFEQMNQDMDTAEALIKQLSKGETNGNINNN